jgi:glycosyltransferase involved in cell wall biosynthesis
MPAFFKLADVMLLSLKDDIVLSKTAPAKLQAYMSCGKPVLGMLNGDGADIISEADCGLVAPAGNYAQLAANILNVRNMPAHNLSRMGHSGLLYYEKNFNREKCLSNLQEIILDYSGKN